MRDKSTKHFTVRINFRHLCLFTALVSCFSCFADDDVKNKKEDHLLKKFNPNYRIQERSPSNFIPDTEFSPAPEQKESWLSYVFVPDRAGVLDSMQKDFDNWRETEEYADNWDMDSTGLYEKQLNRECLNNRNSISTEACESEFKVRYFNRRILKYVDKRISGKIKRAKKGSTFHAVGQAQKALKPDTNVKVNEYIDLKFKARVLRGQLIMNVRNPYLHADTTYHLGRGLQMNFEKRFDETGTKCRFEYRPLDDQMNATVEQQVSKKITTQVTHNNFHQNLWDTRLLLSFNTPFNPN